DAVVLHGEHLAGAAEPRLDFIGNQQDAVFVAQRAQSLHELGRADVEAAFSLHGFDDDGGDPARVDISVEQAAQPRQSIGHRNTPAGVGVGSVIDVGGKGA